MAVRGAGWPFGAFAEQDGRQSPDRRDDQSGSAAFVSLSSWMMKRSRALALLRRQPGARRIAGAARTRRRPGPGSSFGGLDHLGGTAGGGREGGRALHGLVAQLVRARA